MLQSALSVRPAGFRADQPEPLVGDPRAGLAARDGSSRIEQRVVARVRSGVHGLAARTVAELLLFPLTPTQLAPRCGYRTPAPLYNVWANRGSVPARLHWARALAIPYWAVAEMAVLPLAPPSVAPKTRVRAHDDDPPPYRDGANPLERRLVERIENLVPRFGAALIVDLLIAPLSKVAFCAEHGVHASNFSNMLAWSDFKSYMPQRRALARWLMNPGATEEEWLEEVRVLVEYPPATGPAPAVVQVRAL